MADLFRRSLSEGDPDVWDFYGSVGLAPLLTVGPLSAWAIYMLAGTRPASRNVADRPAQDAQRLSRPWSRRAVESSAR